MTNEELLILAKETLLPELLIEAAQKELLSNHEFRDGIFQGAVNGNQESLEYAEFFAEMANKGYEAMGIEPTDTTIEQMRNHLDEYGIRWKDPSKLESSLRSAHKTVRGARDILKKIAVSPAIGVNQLLMDVGTGIPNLGMAAVEAISGQETPRIPNIDFAEYLAENAGIESYAPLVFASEIGASLPLGMVRAPAAAAKALSKIPGGAKYLKPIAEGGATGGVWSSIFAASNPEMDISEAAESGMMLGAGLAATLLGGVKGLNTLVQKIGNRSPEQIADLARKSDAFQGERINIADLADSPVGKGVQLMLEATPLSGAPATRDSFSNRLYSKANTLATRLRGSSTKDTIDNDVAAIITDNYKEFRAKSNLNYKEISEISDRYPQAKIPYNKNQAMDEAKKIKKELTDRPLGTRSYNEELKDVSGFIETQEMLGSLPNAPGRTANDLNLLRADLNDQISGYFRKGDNHLAGQLIRIRDGVTKDIEKLEDLIPDEAIKGSMKAANKYYREFVAPYNRTSSMQIAKTISGERDPRLLKTTLMDQKSIPIINHMNKDQKDKVAYMMMKDRVVETGLGEEITPSGLVNAFNKLSKNKKDAIFGDNISEFKEINLLREIGKDTLKRANPPSTGMTGRSKLATARGVIGTAGFLGAVLDPLTAIPIAAAISAGGRGLKSGMESKTLRDAYLRQHVFKPDAYPEELIPLAARLMYNLNEE